MKTKLSLLILGLSTCLSGNLLAQDLLYFDDECSSSECRASSELAIYYFNHENFDLAITFWEKACNLGSCESCFRLGSLFENNGSIEKNIARALTYYNRACEGKYANACEHLGNMYENGKEVKRNFPIAFRYYEAGCNLKSHKSCYALVDFYSKGIGVMQSYEGAQKYLALSCSYGNHGACNRISENTNELAPLTKEPLPPKTTHELIQECNDDNVVSCVEVSKIKQNEGVNSQGEYQHYLDMACTLNDAYSCFELGNLHLPVEEDRSFYKNKVSAKYFKKACDLNFGEGCKEAARRYALKLHPTPIKSQVLPLYEKGCSLNSSDSCVSAGNIYRNGEGVKKDFVNAQKYYKIGCELNNNFACLELGKLKVRGSGSLKDTVEAKRLFKLSCNNLSIGCSNLGDLMVSENGSKVTNEVINIYDKGCNGRDSESCLILAKFYQEGKIVPENLDKSHNYYKKACMLGKKNACSKIGMKMNINQNYQTEQNYVKVRTYEM